MADLRERFDLVLGALESEGEWVTNRIRPGKIILGQLGDIEAGVRQAFFVVRRDQTRDYLDVAALTDRYGIVESADVLSHIDDYYADQHREGQGVAAQLARQLADPRPADVSVTRELAHYRDLARRWTDWRQVRQVCGHLATEMVLPHLTPDGEV